MTSVKKSDYDIKKLIMMQKLEPRTVGLKLTKIAYVDRVIIYLYVIAVVTYRSSVIILVVLHCASIDVIGKCFLGLNSLL